MMAMANVPQITIRDVPENETSRQKETKKVTTFIIIIIKA